MLSSSRLCGVLACLFILSIASSAAAIQPFVGYLEGTVTDTQNKPIQGADVLVRHRSTEMGLLHVKTNAQGKWTILLSQTGLYAISVTTPHTTQAEAYVLFDRSKHIKLTTKLAPKRYLPNPKSPKVRVYLGKKGTKRHKDIAMKKQADGRWVSIIKHKAKTLRYRLDDVTKRGLVVGQQGTIHYNPRNRRYITKLATKKGLARITWRPPAKTVPKQASNVRFDPASEGDIHTLLEAKRKEMNRIYWMLKARRKKSNKYVQYHHRWDAFFEATKRKLAAPQRKEIQTIIKILRFTSYYNKRSFYKQKRKMAKELLKTMAPDSPLWNATYGLFPLVVSYSRAGKKSIPHQSILAYLRKMQQTNPNPFISYHTHSRQVWHWYYSGKYYKKLYRKYKKTLAKHMKQETLSLQKRLAQPNLTAKERNALQTAFATTLAKVGLAVLNHPAFKRFRRKNSKKYLAALAKDPLFFDKRCLYHYRQMKKMQAKWKSPRFAKMLVRSGWLVNSKIKNGRALPPFRLPLLGQKGQFVSNKQLRGNHGLIVFWATWCRPCVRKIPWLTKLHQQFGKKGFSLVSVSLDHSKTIIDDFRKSKHAMPWTHSLLQGHMRSKVKAKFEVIGIPKVFLVDDKGTLIAHGHQLGKAFVKKILEKRYGKAKSEKKN